MNRYAIGLGSNRGNRLNHLQSAVSSLREVGAVDRVSSLYESDPVGGPDQGPFLNAVAILETDLEPEDILERLQEIETAAGRVRAKKWGPRTLDLDILAWTGPAVSTDSLQIPHPLAHEREFVRRPLAEVWPQAPLSRGLDASAVPPIEDQAVDRLATDWPEGLSDRPGKVLVAVQFAWFIAIGLALSVDGSLPDGGADPLRIVGGLLTVIGIVMAFVSMRRLGPAMTAVPEPKEEGSFVNRGFYRWVRHPIYGGVVLFIAGTSLVLDSLIGLVLSLGLLVFFFLKSTYEERRLRIAYPEYGAYRLSVRRRMIPFLF